jgi:hypothetical protein
MKKTTEQLLREIIDLSVQQVPQPMWERSTKWICKFCGDTERGPNIRHKHNCIIAQAKDHLQSL